MTKTSPSMEEDFVERRASTHGLVIRFELLGVIAALVIQTAAALWSFSAMTVKVEFVQQALIEIKEDMNNRMADRYTSRDAAKDFASIKERIIRNEERIVRNDERITILERVKANV